MKLFNDLNKSEIEEFLSLSHQLKITSGIISKEQLNVILSYAKKYHLDYVSLTTRQTIQLYELKISDVDDVSDNLGKSLENTYTRNVFLSPLSGVDKEDAFDVTPYALLVGAYLESHALEYRIPRNFEVSFSNNDKDTAYAALSNLGFVAVTKDGEAFFEVYLAGDFENSAEIALSYDRLIRPQDILYYVAAMVQLYRDKGVNQSEMKDKTKLHPKEIGEDTFFKFFEEYLANVKETQVLEELNPVISEKDVWESELTKLRNVIPQRQMNRYTLILHPECGLMSRKDLEQVVQFINEHEKENIEIRLSLEEDMYIRNLTKDMVLELYAVFEEMVMKSQVEMSVCGVGISTSKHSQKLCREIVSAIKNAGLKENLLPRIHISGDSGGNTRHLVSHLGFCLSKQKVDGNLDEVFEIYAGGEVGNNNAKLGERLGLMSMNQIPLYVVELAKSLEEKEMCFEKFLREERNYFVNLTERYLLP